MLHHLAFATIQVANLVNYNCKRMAKKKQKKHTNIRYHVIANGQGFSQTCDINGFAYACSTQLV